jgi:hypothetical protein
MDYRLLRVFVSSRMSELRPERLQIKAALKEKNNLNAWVYEDDAGAGVGTIERTYLDELAKADLYLGIFWRGFGQYTIEEYERAEQLGKERLIYEKTADIEGKRDPRLQAFLDRVGGQVKSGVAIGRFETVERLVELVTLNVPALLTARYRESHATKPPAPFQAPAPWGNAVARPALLEPLCARLAADQDPPVFRVVVLHGMAGSGKSELAAAAAHDARVRARYPDGVLWGVLGLEPDVRGLLAGWIRELGDREWGETGPESGKGHLNSMLQDRSVLMVLDDAWNAEDIDRLKAGGPNCTVMITTREEVMARVAKAPPRDTIHVGMMETDEGLAVLAGGPQLALEGDERAAALDVAHAVGFLPLALTLARAQADDGVSWAKLADDLRSETQRLETLDDPALALVKDDAKRRQLSLVASVLVSLRRLPPERLQQFAWLAVLPEDTGVPSAAAATLWGVDEPTAFTTLRGLRSSGIILPADPTADGAITYQLHDVMHAMAKRLLTAPAKSTDNVSLPGLALTAESAQSAFLDRHRARRANDAWHTLPDDGYIFDHLLWHLERARQIEEIHALLREEDAKGSNGWFAAREALGQSSGYASDLMHAVRLAGPDLGRAIRYVLMSASLRAVQDRVPPSLLAALLKAKIWTVPQALAYATNRRDKEEKADEAREREAAGASPQVTLVAQRSRALALIADHVKEPQRTTLLLDAYASALQLEEDEHQVIPFIAGILAAAGLTGQAITLARKAESGDPYAFALAAIIEHLQGEARAQLVTDAGAAAAQTQELFRAAAIESVVTYLDAAQIRQLIADAETMESEFFQGQVLATLVAALAALGEIDDARGRAIAIDEPAARAGAFVHIARHAAAQVRVELTESALDLAVAITDKQWGDRLDEALSYLPEAARAIVQFGQAHTSWRTELLGNLTDGLPTTAQQRALDLALTDEDPVNVAQNVAALAPHLDPRLRQDGLQRVRHKLADAGDDDVTARGLAVVLPFAGPARAELLEQTWRALLGIKLDMFREEALTALMPALSDDELEPALDVAAALEDGDARSQAIETMAPRLPARLLPRALDVARTIGDREERLFAQARVAGFLDSSTAANVFSRAGELGESYPRAALLGEFPKPIAESLVDAALAIDRQREDKANLALWLVERYAPLVSDVKRVELFDQAVAAVSEDADLSVMCQVLAAAANLLEPGQVVRILAGFEAAAAHLSELPPGHAALRLRIAAWPALDRQNDAAFLRRAFSALREPHGGADRVLLDFLANQFGHGRFVRLVALVDAIEDPYEKALACGVLLPRAPAVCRPVLVGIALADFEKIEEDDYLTVDEKAQRIGASVLPHSANVDGALDVFATFEDHALRAEALTAIAPNLDAATIPKALGMARQLAPAHRGRALLALERAAVPDTHPGLLDEAWMAMLASPSDLHSDELTSELADRLCTMEPNDLAIFLRERLVSLASLSRPDLLAKLKHLAPAFARAGGTQAIRDTYNAIDDVCRWWP